MRIAYHLPTQTVTVDLTPEEVGELTPAVVEGLAHSLLRMLKEAGATVLPFAPASSPATGEAAEPVRRDGEPGSGDGA